MEKKKNNFNSIIFLPLCMDISFLFFLFFFYIRFIHYPNERLSLQKDLLKSTWNEKIPTSEFFSTNPKSTKII